MSFQSSFTNYYHTNIFTASPVCQQPYCTRPNLGQSQKINLRDQSVNCIFSNRTSCDFSAFIQILLFSATSGNKMLSSLILTE
ncbi:unnamed protein product [Clavelina lepadiformis]|uniref:Uncharacterized protein n=1 Tax=Clavelina lepadiformis TaxID=159417 RepID=A0ABP0G8V2_CLALP